MEFDEVEIIPAVGNGGGAGAGALARAEEGEAGGEGEGFLAAGEQDVDAEFVHRNGDDGEGGHGVDDEHDVGVFFDHGGDLGQRAHHAGGGFVVDEGDGVELTGGKFLLDHGGEDGLTPFDLQGFGLFAAALADVEPFVRERAAHAVEDFFLHEVAQGAFHHAPRRGGGEVDGAGGAEEGLQARVDGFVERGEFGAAVADLRMAESAEGFVRDFDRAGDEEFDVSVGGLVGGVEHGQFSQMKCSSRRRRARCLISSRCGPSADAILS